MLAMGLMWGENARVENYSNRQKFIKIHFQKEPSNQMNMKASGGHVQSEYI